MFPFLKKNQPLDRDQMARLLQTTPELLAQFEAAYRNNVLGTQDPDSLFETNSRQAAAMRQSQQDVNNAVCPEDIKDRIVNELLAQTRRYVYGYTPAQTILPECEPVELHELDGISLESRPQLTGRYIKKDMPGDSYPQVMQFYQTYQTTKDPKKKKWAYDHFRQGLDILDLDEVLYQIIDQNPNSMSHWLPALAEACQGQDFFQIPKTTIVQVPLPILQLTRLEYMDLNRTTMDIVDRWAMSAFQLDESGDYFIKTGTYSSKFDFRNARVNSPKEVRELGEYLLYIHFQALQMASPLCTPTIYGASTTTEWVVREFIQDPENNPSIYKGLPLRTEYRVFLDCDAGTVIGASPYWEPGVMKDRFGRQADRNSPHQMHDYVVFQAHEEILMRRYHENIDRIRDALAPIARALPLQGQWSLDVLQNGQDFWLIDMAQAQDSTFYQTCVPESLRAPKTDLWVPKLQDSNCGPWDDTCQKI